MIFNFFFVFVYKIIKPKQLFSDMCCRCPRIKLEHRLASDIPSTKLPPSVVHVPYRQKGQRKMPALTDFGDELGRLSNTFAQIDTQGEV